MLYHINAADFSDLSPCLLFVRNVCKEMKFLQIFRALNIRINSMYRDEQYDFRENKNVYTNSDTINKLLYVNCKILQSPKINFNLNKCVDDNLFYEKLCSSLKEEGVCKNVIISEMNLNIYHKIVYNFQANIRIYLKDMQKKIVHLTSLLQHY